MRLALVALVAALVILAGVTLNLGGEGSDLPVPAVIELQGKPPQDAAAPALEPLAPPALPPPPLPVESSQQPPVTVASGEHGVHKQAVVNRRPVQPPVALAPRPARGNVEEIRYHVSFSSTRDYRYDCRDPDDPDDDDLDECDEDDKAEPARRDESDSGTDSDDD